MNGTKRNRPGASATAAAGAEWAVVTGASDGIGRALAIELARRGHKLVLVARREMLLRDLASALLAMHDTESRVVAADLADPGAPQALADATADLDVGWLVAAAGFGTSGPLVESALDVEREMIAVNCAASLALCSIYGRRFAARGRGSIVLMSSLVGFQGVPGAANYAATKAYVQALAEGLREELAPFGVDVLACAPGPVASGFGARAGMRMSVAQRPEQLARSTLDAVGRVGTHRPGFLSKFLGWSLATLPRWAAVKVMARIMAGMTAPHAAPPASGSPSRGR